MILPPRLVELLEEEGVPYEIHEHAKAYTAQEVAAAEHVPGGQVAKAVMLAADDDLIMAVLPADRRVDFDRAAEQFGRPVRLAEEAEFQDRFPDSEVGAEPPFGTLYGIPTYLDRSVEADELVFPAGDHTHTIHMARSDYEKLVHPQEIEVATEA